MQKILVICGSTATGKTDLAFRLAKDINGELVSADSRQIYRGLDLISGKGIEKGVKKPLPWKEKNVKYYWEIGRTPVYLLDVADPHEEFSVANYYSQAKRAIKHIHSKGKLAIIVGGTGLYIKSLINPIDTLGIPPMPDLRKKYELKSAEELFMILARLNPDLANSLNRSEQKNKRRLVRKIEIAQSVRVNDKPVTSTFDSLVIGLKAPKDILKERIAKRVDAWMDSGVEEEARRLLEANMTNQAGTAIVLPAWKKYFSGEVDRDWVAEYWKAKDWQYAKRQMTWFRKYKEINWFDIDSHNWQDKVAKRVRAWYNYI